MSEPPADYLAEYLALRAANDQRREAGRRWLHDSLLSLCEELPVRLPLRLGRQEWSFVVEGSTMVGERLGVRHGAQTLVVEIGWPRLPQDGFVPGAGLARGRVGLSANIMLEAAPIAELILRAGGADEPQWQIVGGPAVTVDDLRHWLARLLADQ